MLYPFFLAMMIEALRNSFHRATKVKAKLADLAQDDGTTIGNGLKLTVLKNATPESAVDEWIDRYP